MTVTDQEDRHDTSESASADRFVVFFTEVEPRLRRALVAAYGPETGLEATREALAWAWEHFDRVESMTNAGGYLWRVGQTHARRSNRRQTWPGQPADEVSSEPVFEPGLADGLSVLSERQRVAVLLVHAYGYSLNEASQQLGCRIRTLRHHLERGMAKLRDHLGSDDA